MSGSRQGTSNQSRGSKLQTAVVFCYYAINCIVFRVFSEASQSPAPLELLFPLSKVTTFSHIGSPAWLLKVYCVPPKHLGGFPILPIWLMLALFPCLLHMRTLKSKTPFLIIQIFMCFRRDPMCFGFHVPVCRNSKQKYQLCVSKAERQLVCLRTSTHDCLPSHRPTSMSGK